MATRLVDVQGRPLRFQEPGRAPRGELGAPGTAVFDGIVTEQDYNTDLQGESLYKVFDRMRMADGQVRAGLAVIKLPLIRATWSVKPGDDSPFHREIADFLQRDLMGMTLTWASFLRQTLLCLDYGAMLFEPVWEVRDDSRVHLRKLAPRLPRTVLEWKVDAHGGFDGIKQQVITSEAVKEVTIPAEKLLVFVNEQEGANFRGTSVLRAAYKHWFFKDKLYIVDAISKERRGVGVDVGTIEENAAPTTQTDLEAALMTLHAHEKQFFIEELGKYKYRVEGLGGAGVLDALNSIEHHDVRILRSILAEFLAMGADSTGSLAMHRDKSSFFIMALKAIGQLITDTMTTHLIRPWVDFNWNVKGVYPEVQHSRLETRDTALLAEAISKLVTAGVVRPDDDLEDEIRVDLDLPERMEPEEEPGAGFRRRRRKVLRKRTIHEQRVNFRELESGLESARDAIVEAVNVLQRGQVEALSKQGERIFDTGKIDDLENVKVVNKVQIARRVRQVLMELYNLGRKEAQREFALQGVAVNAAFKPLDPRRVRQISAFLGVRAAALANLAADRLKTSFVWEMLDQITRGSFNAQKLEGQLSSLSDRSIRRQTTATVSESLNLGRAGAAQENRERIERAIFSSVLDTGTCQPCETADGLELSMDDPRFEEFQPPYRECEGKGNCRCVYVFVMKEEEPPRD